MFADEYLWEQMICVWKTMCTESLTMFLKLRPDCSINLKVFHFHPNITNLKSDHTHLYIIPLISVMIAV